MGNYYSNGRSTTLPSLTDYIQALLPVLSDSLSDGESGFPDSGFSSSSFNPGKPKVELDGLDPLPLFTLPESESLEETLDTVGLETAL